MRGGLLSRFSKPEEGRVIVIMQRLHNDDLIGSLIQSGGWDLLSLPGEFPDNRVIPLGGDKDWKVRAGDLLFPELFPRTVLDQQRQEYGQDRFNAMILQRPSPPGGSIFRLKWFRRYRPDKIDHSLSEMVIQSWDTAETDHVYSDYSVCTTWAVRGKFFVLLDVFRAQLPYHKLEQAVLEQRAKWKASLVILEEAGVGRTLTQQLRNVNGHSWIQSMVPRDGKVLRAERETTKVEGGRVFIPTKAPWLDAFTEEVAVFPHGKHDDQVDSMTQFLHYFDRAGPLHHTIANLTHSRQLARERFGL